MMDVFFRNAEKKDAEKVLALYNQVRNQKYCTWNEDYPVVEDIQRDLENDNLFVLCEGERLIGAISIVSENELDELPLWQYKRSAGEFARVVIDRTYQGKGLAREMVREIEKVLFQRKKEVVHILVSGDNLPAMGTYLPLGYQKCGTTEMFGHVFTAMEKRL